MSDLLISSPWKRALILLGVFGGLWATALVCKVPETPFSVISSPSTAQELGALGAPPPSSGEEICALAISPDGALLATGARNGFTQLWDAATRAPTIAWKAHEKSVS